ncbi:MAG: acyl-CoA dehydrogenase family protein [Pirellulales bacterium]
MSELGGYGWNDVDQLRGYLDLSEACLTTAFILTQRAGAVRRIAAYANDELHEVILPDLLSGATFATVAISHLTTSRQHVAAPAVRTEPVIDGWILDGSAPWVTGATFADHIVVGATQPDGKQVLLCVPGKAQGVIAQPPLELIALTASCTGPLDFEGMHVRANVCWPVRSTTSSAARRREDRRADHFGLGDRTCRGIGHVHRTRSREATGVATDRRRTASRTTGVGRAVVATGGGQRSLPAPDLRARANSMALRSAKPRSPRPREPASPPDIRPDAMPARRCFFWSGAVRSWS